MLTFIVPLQSPAVSRNWEKVQALACRTVRSLCQQESSEFAVVLVCNEAPDHLPKSPRLHLVEKAFPLPEKGKGMRDKFTKVKMGLVYTRKYLPATQFIMPVDADDVVSKRLVSHVIYHSSVRSGFHCQKGYLYSDRHDFFTRMNDLDRICGSTYIIKVDTGTLPCEVESECVHPLLTKGHTVIGKYFTEIGQPLDPVPFRSVAYVTDTSENDSGITSISSSRSVNLRRLCKRVIFPQRLRREFGLVV